VGIAKIDAAAQALDEEEEGDVAGGAEAQGPINSPINEAGEQQGLGIE
jgi:hypothetical protein